MIGKLTGRVDDVSEDRAVVDVGGVGYEVHCPARTLAGLPPRGTVVTLYVETHVRDEMIRLYGFATAAERSWFRLLQSVQGVGAKVALAVLGVLGPSELASAVALGDSGQIARAHGVGPKVAKRIAVELKDKAAELGGAGGLAGGLAPVEGGAGADAVSALVNLGYGRSEAASAVAGAVRVAGQSAAAEELIRLGLRELAR